MMVYIKSQRNLSSFISNKNEIFDLTELHAFNEKIYNEFEINSTKNFSKVIFPGIFFGNKLLVIAQNPGQPYINDVESIKLHKIKNHNYKDFELQHLLSYQKSKLYNFLLNFIKQFDLNINDISYTNYVKYATFDNDIPGDTEFEQFDKIIKRQVSLLEPEEIICFGKKTSQQLMRIKIPHIPYYHPAYFQYQKTMIIK